MESKKVIIEDKELMHSLSCEESSFWSNIDLSAKLEISKNLLSICESAIFYADKELTILYANKEFIRRNNCEKFESVGLNLFDLYHEPMNVHVLNNAKVVLGSVKFWSGELARKREDGTNILEEARFNITVVKDKNGKNVEIISGILTDVTEKKLATEQLEWAKNHDKLTSLANRSLFSSALDSIIKRSDENNTILVVVAIDLNKFKYYNSDYGYHIGDEILKTVARKLAGVVRAGDICARIGGDEFGVLMPVHHITEAQDVLRRIQNCFEETFEIFDYIFNIKCNIGAAVWPNDGNKATELLSAAEIAQQMGKDAYKPVLYEPSFMKTKRGKLALENDLRNALDENLLMIHYQPVVSVQTGSIEAVEALVRWNDPTRGLIQPGGFIPLAEETGMIIRLGEMVMRSALKQGTAWNQDGNQNVRVAVNVSPIQMRDEKLPRLIAELLTGTKLPPENLIIEITESVLLDKIDEAENVIKRLKNLGVTISIDDFGTGYSSLSYLRRLPIDILKIDREFITDISSSGSALEIVEGIIGLSHKMGLQVTAEGVETAEQFYLLKKLNCDFAQGFLFSKALPAQEFEDRYLQKGTVSRFSSFRWR